MEKKTMGIKYSTLEIEKANGGFIVSKRKENSFGQARFVDPHVVSSKEELAKLVLLMAGNKEMVTDTTLQTQEYPEEGVTDDIQQEKTTTKEKKEETKS